MTSEILRGWKEIEAAIRLTRMSILRNGYPVMREPTGRVYALRSALLAHVTSRSAGRACPAATQ